MPEESAATPAEITTAMEVLTAAALLRLRNYARWRVRGLGRKAAGRTETELLADAMNATLEGKRRWNKDKVDFVGHLVGAMRSISSHWRGQSKSADEATLESDLLRTTEDGEVLRPFDLVPSEEPGPDEELEANESQSEARTRVEAIENAFADDPVISLILDGLRQGMTPGKVRAELELSQTEYETAMNRLRRRMRAAAGSGASDA
ncbi:MAG: hypothetical protein DMD87_03485 [Candidatus Rokuibacteriota bacterium]|nr:MAG: hypothetical protein DMD87_03485 [Candidatus Rokubacteria bacterium]